MYEKQRLTRRPTVTASAPALMMHEGDVSEAARRGTVLFYHSFDQSREDMGEELSALAQAGFLAVGVDNACHGERRLPDFDRRFGGLGPGPELETAFLSLVRETVREVPEVVDDLIARGLAIPERVGVAGWSMGGFVAYAAVVADPRIRVAAPSSDRRSGGCTGRTAHTGTPISSSLWHCSLRRRAGM